MAYATLADLKARAGALAQAWHDNSEPSNTDIERIIDQVAGEIDALIVGAGFSLPVDDTAAGALVSINADKALLIALDATYGGDHANVRDLRASIQKRVDVYDNAAKEGDITALIYLGSTAAGATLGGAGDFWTIDGAQDYYWSLYGGYWPFWGDEFGIPLSQGPAFRKNQRL